MPHVFTKDNANLRLLLGLGASVSISGEMSSDSQNVSRAALLRRRNRELSILNTIAEALNREVDLQRALNAALLHVTELLELNTSWIWLLDQNTAESFLAGSHNLPPALSDDPQIMEGTCYCLKRARARSNSAWGTGQRVQSNSSFSRRQLYWRADCQKRF